MALVDILNILHFNSKIAISKAASTYEKDIVNARKIYEGKVKDVPYEVLRHNASNCVMNIAYTSIGAEVTMNITIWN